MSMIENDLRAALRALGDEVPADGVPPLRLPGDEAPWNGSGPLSGAAFSRARWLAPAAAAAAVLAIAVGAIAIGGQPRHHPRPVTGASRPCAVSARANRVPRYYIAPTGTKRPYAGNPYVAGIYRTSTGARVATFAYPGLNQTVAKVSVAADDRTFAIATQDASANLPATSFSLIHFSASVGSASAGVSQALRLSVPAGATFDGFALSPDGSKLAVAFEPNQNAPGLTEELRVLDIRAGTVRTWTSAQGAIAGDTADPWSLSWGANSTTLAFNWYGTGSGLRLLDVAAPGSNVVADSKLSVPIFSSNGNHATTAGNLSDIVMLTPDCKTVVGAVTSPHGDNGGFAEFSAATGHLRRVLDWGPMGTFLGGGPMDVLWTSADGSTLVVYAPPGHSNRIGILHGGKLTLLPQSARIQFPGAAW
jgi:hypothetical protein